MTDIQLSIKEKMFRQLIAIAKADGTIHPKEKQVLKSLGIRMGFSVSEIDQMFAQDQSYPVFAILDTSQRFTHLMNIFRIAIADGEIQEPEIAQIRKLMLSLGYPQEHSQELIEIAMKQVS